MALWQAGAPPLALGACPPWRRSHRRPKPRTPGDRGAPPAVSAHPAPHPPAEAARPGQAPGAAGPEGDPAAGAPAAGGVPPIDLTAILGAPSPPERVLFNDIYQGWPWYDPATGQPGVWLDGQSPRPWGTDVPPGSLGATHAGPEPAHIVLRISGR
eukprot:8550444-Alexandrium_andersonii.AAC.1